MIKLYSFGRRFGLPDPSPFVTKTEVLLKMAKLEYTMDTNGFTKAPKGKLPYINDNGQKIADSTFIRIHLEKTYGVDFDKGLSKSERAVAWAFEKMCEEHLYFALLDARWLITENFERGPATFFKSIPFFIRPMVVKMVRGKIQSAVKAQGMGRHSRAEIESLAALDLAAIADFLGDKPYLMGESPTSADACVFAFVSGCLCPVFTTGLRVGAERHENLRRYSERMLRRFYPELAGPQEAPNAATHRREAHT